MSNPQRQHPLMLLSSFWEGVKGMILPLGLSLFLHFQGDSGESDNVYLYISYAVAAWIVLRSFLKWLFFRYDYSNSVLEIQHGALIRKKRNIHRERIQTINIQASLLLRMFGLVSVHIETAASMAAEAEIHIAAIKKEAAYALKEQIDSERQTLQDSTVSEAEYEANSITVPWSRHILGGLTSGGLGITASIVSLFFFQFYAYIPEATRSALFDLLAQSQPLFIAALVLSILFVSWMISLFRHLMRYAYFRITEKHDELQIQHGLLSTRHLSVKKHRIQSVSFSQSLFRQLLGLWTVQIDSAGGVSYNSTDKVVLHPLLKQSEIAAFHKQMLFSFNITVPEDTRKPPKKAIRYYLTRAFLPFIVVFPVAWFFPYVLWVLLLAPFFAALAILRYNDAALGIVSDRLYLETRRVSRRRVSIYKHRIQSLRITQTIFQRWRNTANIAVLVLSAPMNATYIVKDLSFEDAEELYAWFSQ